MAYEVDSDKAHTLFLRLLISSRKLKEREVSRKELVSHLEKLRKVKINKAFKQNLDVLDTKLADVLKKERAILSSQQAEHRVHNELSGRIKQ